MSPALGSSRGNACLVAILLCAVRARLAHGLEPAQDASAALFAAADSTSWTRLHAPRWASGGPRCASRRSRPSSVDDALTGRRRAVVGTPAFTPCTGTHRRTAAEEQPNPSMGAACARHGGNLRTSLYGRSAVNFHNGRLVEQQAHLDTTRLAREAAGAAGRGGSPFATIKITPTCRRRDRAAQAHTTMELIPHGASRLCSLCCLGRVPGMPRAVARRMGGASAEPVVRNLAGWRTGSSDRQ